MPWCPEEKSSNIEFSNPLEQGVGESGCFEPNGVFSRPPTLLYPPDVAEALSRSADSAAQSGATPCGWRKPKRAKGSISYPIEAFPVHRIWAFWRKVDRGWKGANDCWQWKGATDTAGYGRFKVSGQLFGAHRIALALTKGGVPQGKGHHGAMVCHSCDNPPCCNPNHLFLGDARANARDMVEKGRARPPSPSVRGAGP